MLDGSITRSLEGMPIVTTKRQLEYMKEHFPKTYAIALKAIKDGKAIVTQEASGCGM